MADEDPWAIEDPSESTEVQPELSIQAEVSSAAPVEAGPEDHLPPDDDRYRKPIVLYKHWVRPKFLQYNYLYDYRVNYYDDVIDYLDKRSRGLNRDVPRAQLWAERVLRTNSHKPSYTEMYEHQRKEREMAAFSSSIKFHNYHTKAYINRKYSSVL